MTAAAAAKMTAATVTATARASSAKAMEARSERDEFGAHPPDGPGGAVVHLHGPAVEGVGVVAVVAGAVAGGHHTHLPAVSAGGWMATMAPVVMSTATARPSLVWPTVSRSNRGSR